MEMSDRQLSVPAENEESRGKFWEITYRKNGWSPVVVEFNPRERLDTVTGLVSTKITAKKCDLNESGALSGCHLKNRDFVSCDFRLSLYRSSFENCTFRDCDFSQHTWTEVSFTNCTFERCNFVLWTFDSCSFLNTCKFAEITFAHHKVNLQNTAISASSFLAAIVTNVENLPPDVDKEYQEHRLVGSKLGIAVAIYQSTKDVANLEYYFEAYKELRLATLRKNVEFAQYPISTARFARFRALIASLGPRLELLLAEVTGGLTNWGQSVVLPLEFALWVFLFFIVIYGLFADTSLVGAIQQSFNITIVAGYTFHLDADDAWHLKMLKAINLIFGLFWYSLLIPTVVRRVLR